MNSNPYNTHGSHNPDDEISDSQSDGSSNSSASSSRAERLRRERTQRQRHRQRLQRAKQLQQHTQQHQHQQHIQSQHHQQSRERSSSESSNGSAASSGVGSSRRQLTQSAPTTSAVSSNAGSSTNGNSPTRQARGGAANSDNTTNTIGIVTQQILTNQQAKQAQSSSHQRPQQNQPQQPQQYSQNSLNFQNGPRKAPSSEPTANSVTSPSSPHGSNSRSQQSNVKAPPPPPSNPPNISNNSNNASSSTSQQQSSQQQPQQKPPPPPPMISSHKGPVLVSVESPLPPLVQRSLGDRSYDKRKNAALEIEQLVKSLSDAHNIPMIQSIISVLAKDFCTSMNANYRKGGLIGIAATAIGLMGNTRSHLEGLLFPVLHCFDDPESRVRYYACESLYNIAKVARGSILRYFNQIFDGLTKLFADVDVDVKNGANLLDRLVKDIVTESESFHVEQFLPLLQSYIRRTNPYIRQLLVGWITVLDSVPDISMIDYLPDFLDGLFNMLSDSNREIRQAADSALSDFLKEVRHSTVLEFGPLVSILVHQCLSKERLNRLTAITWIEELIHHPHSGGDELLPHHAEVLGAILFCISDLEEQICLVAERTNADLLTLVRDTHGDFRLAPLLETLIDKFMTKDDVPTKMASLRWINMLLEKRRSDMTEFVPRLMPVLLKTLSDSSDSVVLFTLQVLARISLGDGGVRIDKDSTSGDEDDGRVESQDNLHSGLLRGRKDAKHFKLVINAILKLFASDRMLLESRGSLVIRKLCVLLDAESVYMLCASILSSSCESSSGDVLIEENKVSPDDEEDDPSSRTRTGSNTESTVVFSIEFISTMVQTLNLILLTASELHGLRVLLAKTFDEVECDSEEISCSNPGDENICTKDGAQVFETLFRCWCHSPVATFSLCLLARSYRVAFALVQKFSELEVTVGFLMQIDKLVQLLESPIFIHLRLQLLDVESPHHAPLLKSCYGLLMLLPQSDAFRSLNDRLTTVCNLRDNLGIPPTNTSRTSSLRLGAMPQRQCELLTRFDEVMDLHRKMRGREVQQMMTGEFFNDRVNRGRQSSDSVGTNGKLSSTRVKVNGNGPGSVGGSSTGGIASNRNTPSSVFFPNTDNNGGSSSTTNNSSAPIRGKITQEV